MCVCVCVCVCVHVCVCVCVHVCVCVCMCMQSIIMPPVPYIVFPFSLHAEHTAPTLSYTNLVITLLKRKQVIMMTIQDSIT